MSFFNTHMLEPLQEKHIWRLCNFMISNEDRFKTYLPITLEQNLTPELSKLFVRNKLKLANQKKEYVFLLKHAEERTIDGIFYLKEVDWIKKQAEFAYGIAYEIEGKGYTTKVVKALSNHAFKDLQIKKLKIITHKTNIASVNVAKKCGFNWVKTVEKSFTPTGSKPLDMELYELDNER